MPRDHQDAAPTRTRLRGGLGLAVLASLAVVAPAQAAAPGPQAHAAASGKPPGFIAIATVAGQPLVGGRVQVFARTAAARRPAAFTGRAVTAAKHRVAWFEHELLPAKAKLVTNKQGGATSAVNGLPRSFLVKVTGGKVGGRPFRGSVLGLGDSSEQGVVVNQVTTIAAAYSRKHPQLSTRAASRRIRQLLDLPQLTGGTLALGRVGAVESIAFSPAKLAAAAARKGGLAKLSAKLAAIAADPKARVTYEDPAYRIPTVSSVRPSSTRTTGRRPATPRDILDPAGILENVLDSAIYSDGCALAGSSLTGNLLCGGGGSGGSGIGQAIQTLETSLINIQTTLNEMETQLVALGQDAAAQAYQDAYTFAGIDPVNSLVGSASSDLNFIYASAPSAAPVPGANAGAETASEQCQAVYTINYVNGQDPFDLCVDFLSQAAEFSAPSTAYYASMYKSITGAGSQPIDNLLTYTYQQVAIAYASNVVVPQSTLAQVESSIGQVVQLQANAFSVLANAQIFQTMVQTGKQPTCSDVQMSGTWAADTSPNVADVCNTADTALFESSVQSYMAPYVTVPPAGALVDTHSGYVWWGYPVDVSGATDSSGSYPYYPGAATGTYTGVGLNAITASPQAILATAPGYGFSFANTTTMGNLFTNQKIPSGGTTNTLMGDLGFVGLGTTAYGLDWQKLGVAISSTPYSTVVPWNVTTSQGYTTCSVGKYPVKSGSFDCTNISVDPEGYYGVVLGVAVTAALASETYTMTGTSIPTSASQCAAIPESSYDVSATSPPDVKNATVHNCTNNTYGLLVDSTPGAAGSGGAPLWTAAMLTGPPNAGVPALTIPPPS